MTGRQLREKGVITTKAKTEKAINFNEGETSEISVNPGKNARETFKIGDVVQFMGCLQYTNSYASGVAKACKAGLAKVTSLSLNNPHPYQLQAIVGKGSTVYGWVNEEDIAGKTDRTGKICS